MFGVRLEEFVVNAAVLLPLFTLLLTFVLNEMKKRREEKSARRKYLVALCTEIQLNTDSLEKATRNIPPTQASRLFLQSGPASPNKRPADDKDSPVTTICYRPHLINTYLDHVFKQHINVLADMPDTLIRSIIDFYGKLDWIDIIVASIEKQSFASISVEGRETILEQLKITIYEAKQQGTEVLGAIKLLLDPRRPF